MIHFFGSLGLRITLRRLSCTQRHGSAMRGTGGKTCGHASNCFGFGAAMLIHSSSRAPYRHGSYPHASMAPDPFFLFAGQRPASIDLQACFTGVGRSRSGACCSCSLCPSPAKLDVGACRTAKRLNIAALPKQGITLHKSTHQNSPLLIHTDFTRHAIFHVEQTGGSDRPNDPRIGSHPISALGNLGACSMCVYATRKLPFGILRSLQCHEDGSGEPFMVS